ncbi:tannase/feruloyl esterase family alpha/beta hydrolase [Streptomyces sp. VRA16 Mangrove soil]|uniref:tannase/feruloyl esterase family alpha/beta hydrolase n=1 Tax=Streptomyces sp. VRA16 Mangrove soil TaxID=2817434 RepID=UPI001A9F97ED|nr:tannase/feruloyl esterase family alpha/beta hydrolase [Streptomyces sp. VRA16 Mangrove soil]MBO1329859.1 tannase/feruloyl esterase family alpha/beta hydrolase [Streptomyces sp. VRA16 Mangrove soil]
MKKALTVMAAGVPLVAAAVCLPTASADETRNTATTTATTTAACAAPSVKAPAGARVESVTAVRDAGGAIHGSGVLGGDVYDVPAFCKVTVTLTHPGQDDHATVQTWLPLEKWNGRFQAIGGSAYAAGDNGVGLGTAVKNGYAVTTTDAGVGDVVDTSWVLDGQGRINRTALKNFASRSQHEAAVVGKEVVNGVYAQRAAYSYFTGCSTGGRQGYMEAQAYPDDYDGILADAPGINWTQFEVATLWPQVVLNNEKTYPTDCELKAFTAAAVKACDKLDGVTDGVVNDASRCDFDPRRLIGTKVVCDGKELTITVADATVVRKIWDGPRTTSGQKLWSGVPIGADLTGLAHSQPDAATGVVKGVPFPVPAAWVQLFLEKDPSFDLTKITYSDFTKLFQQSVAEYDDVIGTSDPDLSGFRKSGGKLITWHGQADQFIPTQGTVDYRKQVERQMGGSQRVDDFYRLFLAPDTDHCGLNGQDGSADGLAALTDWVEHGKAPETLPATLINAQGEQVDRDLCAYPEVSRYKGHGDPSLAASFRCVSPSRH